MSRVCKRCVEQVDDACTSCPVCGCSAFEGSNPVMVTVEWPKAFTFDGPPVTPEMQRLLGGYGGAPVEGIVALPAGLQVGYANGVQLTFAPFHSGGRIGGNGESRGLAGAQVIGGCCG